MNFLLIVGSSRSEDLGPFLKRAQILRTGGTNDKEEVHRTSSPDGRLPASSSDPLRILTRRVPRVGDWRRGHCTAGHSGSQARSPGCRRSPFPFPHPSGSLSPAPGLSPVAAPRYTSLSISQP